MQPKREEGHRPRIQVGGVPFEVTSLPAAARVVLDHCNSTNPVPVRLANAYCVAEASRDQDYHSLMHGHGLNFPDGAPVVWFMRRASKGAVQPRRVRGPSLFRAVIGDGQALDVRHFFLGTTAETLVALRNAVHTEYPDAIVAGMHSPSFGPLDETFYTQAIAEIDRSEPDIVWIALGSPKQDFAAAEISRRTGRTCVGIGAAFDFVAGSASEAPEWMQRSGIEWTYRLATEPRRLWKRYLFGNLRFLKSALSRYRSI